MHYILIIALWSYGHGGAPATAEFNSQAACESAVAVLRKADAASSRVLLLAECVPKGPSLGG